jgi:hypothetical protein
MRNGCTTYYFLLINGSNGDKIMLVENVITIVNGLKGVLDVQLLSNIDKKDLLKIEASRKDDIIPVINEGLNECLNREFCLVMFKTSEFRIPPEPTVLLKTDTGKILGQELISIENKENYSNRNDVIFLSNNFILFKPKKVTSIDVKEKEQFILPPIPFPELDELNEIVDVVSGTPSTAGDEYIKNRFCFPQDPKIATVLVGFSKKMK